MAFENIVGQEAVVARLRMAIGRDRLPSGMIFHGLDGVGKRTTALELARSLNCDGDDPQMACPACVRIERGSHPDVQFLAPEGQFIKVDQIEPLVARALFRPFEGRKRIYIVDRAECIREETASRLLKTLEEPPLFTHFVLLTASLPSVLPTIRSRCGLYYFAELASEAIEHILVDRLGHPPAEARRRAERCGGSIGRALALDELDFSRYDETAAWLDQALLHSDATPAELVSQLLKVGAKGKVDVDDILDRIDIMTEILHGGMVGRRRLPTGLSGPDEAFNFFLRLMQARAMVAGNVAPDMVLEETILHWNKEPLRKWTETFVRPFLWV